MHGTHIRKAADKQAGGRDIQIENEEWARPMI
jgi:hypothetical protein